MERKSEGQTNLQAGTGAASEVAGGELASMAASKLPLPLPFKILAMGGSYLGGSYLAGKGMDTLTGANKPKGEKPKPKATTTQPMQTPMGNPAKPSNAASSAPPSGGITIPSMGLSYSPLTTTAPKEDTTKNVTPAAVATPAETKPAETKPAEITQAETKSVPKGMPNVGPAAKPKPNVVVATAPSQNRQSGPAKSSAPATQVPNIPSSNPDNFYALYSQLNYNVVM
jgi:hypothetical protein